LTFWTFQTEERERLFHRGNEHTYCKWRQKYFLLVCQMKNTKSFRLSERLQEIRCFFGCFKRAESFTVTSADIPEGHFLANISFTPFLSFFCRFSQEEKLHNKGRE
jgi:hypothetical protein